MTAAKVIEEINVLPPDEQAKVIQPAFQLARQRQLSADELVKTFLSSRQVPVGEEVP